MSKWFLLIGASFLCVGLSGCFNPNYGSQSFACGKNGSCPTGYQCVANICTQDHTKKGDGGSGSDGQINSDGKIVYNEAGKPTLCSSPRLIAENIKNAPEGSTISVEVRPDGQADVLYIGEDGRIYHWMSNQPNSSKTLPEEPRASQLATAMEVDSEQLWRLHLAFIDEGNTHIRHQVLKSNQDWAAPTLATSQNMPVNGVDIAAGGTQLRAVVINDNTTLILVRIARNILPTKDDYEYTMLCEINNQTSTGASNLAAPSLAMGPSRTFFSYWAFDGQRIIWEIYMLPNSYLGGVTAPPPPCDSKADHIWHLERDWPIDIGQPPPFFSIPLASKTDAAHAVLNIDNNPPSKMAYRTIRPEDPDIPQESWEIVSPEFPGDPMSSSIAVDNKDQPHIVYVGLKDGNPSIVWATKSQNVWQVTEIDQGEGPRTAIAVGEARAHIVYQKSKSSNGQEMQNDLYYVGCNLP